MKMEPTTKITGKSGENNRKNNNRKVYGMLGKESRKSKNSRSYKFFPSSNRLIEP